MVQWCLAARVWGLGGFLCLGSQGFVPASPRKFLCYSHDSREVPLDPVEAIGEVLRRRTWAKF